MSEFVIRDRVEPAASLAMSAIAPNRKSIQSARDPAANQYELMVLPEPRFKLRTGARIMRYELSDDEWTAIKPMLPNKPRGVRRVNDRRVLNGIFVRCAMARPARDYGPRTTCYNRFVRWRQAGVWDQIMDRWLPVMTRRCR